MGKETKNLSCFVLGHYVYSLSQQIGLVIQQFDVSVEHVPQLSCLHSHLTNLQVRSSIGLCRHIIQSANQLPTAGQMKEDEISLNVQVA